VLELQAQADRDGALTVARLAGEGDAETVRRVRERVKKDPEKYKDYVWEEAQ
jgi:hypothetical protein